MDTNKQESVGIDLPVMKRAEARAPERGVYAASSFVAVRFVSVGVHLWFPAF
jgi:hypothetical protein